MLPCKLGEGVVLVIVPARLPKAFCMSAMIQRRGFSYPGCANTGCCIRNGVANKNSVYGVIDELVHVHSGGDVGIMGGIAQIVAADVLLQVAEIV